MRSESADPVAGSVHGRNTHTPLSRCILRNPPATRRAIGSGKPSGGGMDIDTEVPAGPPETGRTVADRLRNRVEMTVPDRHNPTLHRVIELVNADDELYALWMAANVNAMERLGMTDH